MFDNKQNVVRELVRAIGDLHNRLFHSRIEDPEEFDIDLLRFGHSYFSLL